MSSLLSVNGLRVGFGDRAEPTFAVRDVSFSVDPGEVVALVGESGSGKSVTALSIMRLVEYGGGQIHGGQLMFDAGDGAVDLASSTRSEMANLRGKVMAMIFQEPMTSLNPIFTVGEQIMEALRLHRRESNTGARERAIGLLERVSMPNPESQMARYPHELSGGQRQRVMLAIAIACGPRLLIADEPTTALDVTIQAQILNLLRDLQAETGMALLFITHDMAVVAEIADRVVVMRNGEIVEDSRVTDLFMAPRHAYTRALLAAAPRLGALSGTAGPRRFAEPSYSKSAPPLVGDRTPLLEVRDVVTRFPVRTGLFRRKSAEVHAVEMASLDILTGQTLALVGESGSGKSTLARSVLRLIEPASGSIRLRGRNLIDLDPEEMRKMRAEMQIVFQDPLASMNPRRRVYDQIADPVRIHRRVDEAELRKRVEGLIQQVGMQSDCLERYPHEFSGGQRQRLCVARALSLSPSLIVADEPVSALDVSIQAQVVDLLIELQERLNISYLFISHDMAVVERIAHQVAVMRRGRIVELGPRRAVFETPQHPYTRQLLDAVPIADPGRRYQKNRQVHSAPSKSPIHPIGVRPTPMSYKEVSPGHLVENIIE